LVDLFKPILEKISQYSIAHPELKIADPQAAQLFVGTLAHFHISQEILHGKEVMPIERSRVVDNLIEMMLKSIE
jgi:TetR/AcrR family transcriptional regulator, regulator of autoinduction and epiphytic fitness